MSKAGHRSPIGTHKSDVETFRFVRSSVDPNTERGQRYHPRHDRATDFQRFQRAGTGRGVAAKGQREETRILSCDTVSCLLSSCNLRGSLCWFRFHAMDSLETSRFSSCKEPRSRVCFVGCCDREKESHWGNELWSERIKQSRWTGAILLKFNLDLESRRVRDMLVWAALATVHRAEKNNRN